MKAALLFTGSGPIVILTSHASVTDAQLIAKLRAKGIDKFVAYEIPIDLAKQRYDGHFDMVMRDLSQTDDLRVLDFNGERAFRLFRISELGKPVVHEP
ncbi:MAG: cytosolic protein [Pseudomonadota bacterium]